MKKLLLSLTFLTLMTFTAFTPSLSASESNSLDLQEIDTPHLLKALEALKDIDVNLQEQYYILSFTPLQEEHTQKFSIYVQDEEFDLVPDSEFDNDVDLSGVDAYTFENDTEAWGDYQGVGPGFLSGFKMFTNSELEDVKIRAQYYGDITDLTPSFTSSEDTYYLPLGHTLLASNLTIEAQDELNVPYTSGYTFEYDDFDHNKVGTYEMDVTITNAVNNTKTKAITVHVIDSTPPTIDAPSHIAKNSEFILPSDFMLNYATAEDNNGEDISDDIYISENGFEGNGNNPGLYDIVLSVRDEHGNRRDHHMQIRVIKDYTPLLVIEENTMLLSHDSPMEPTDFIRALQAVHNLPSDRFDYTNVIDTYTSNADTPGEYRFHFHLVADSGNEFTRSLDVEVVDHDFNYEDAPLNTAQNAMGFFYQWWWLIAIGAIAIVGIIKR